MRTHTHTRTHAQAHTNIFSLPNNTACRLTLEHPNYHYYTAPLTARKTARGRPSSFILSRNGNNTIQKCDTPQLIIKKAKAAQRDINRLEETSERSS